MDARTEEGRRAVCACACVVEAVWYVDTFTPYVDSRNKDLCGQENTEGE